MFSRRQFLHSAAVLTSAAVLPISAHAADQSPLIYLSPIKSDGTLSKCQAEIWYLEDGGTHYVVTAADAWRAEAVRKGLTTARIWTGDVGVWTRSKGAYLDLPQLDATAGFETDEAEHARLLALFGEKYSREWGTWGPRFKKGLADGSRVMLTYVSN